MGIEADTTSGIQSVLAEAWAISKGVAVPKTDAIVMKNGGRRVDATYVYADLAESTWLAQNIKDEIAGKVIRVYLNAAARLLRHFEGEIRSFDGDRVMAIFMGKSKNTDAVRAAFAICGTVRRTV